MVKDPICGMNVDEKTAKFKSEYMGKTYYFCSQMCKATFDKSPAKYAGGHSEHSMHSGHCCH
ncbi:YHS domain-containing protein [Candidatus Bathyarchaeota archaeon]|nr:YHS domain-containing protein [Candidatus Bathyarchaeota archaeon]MBS7631336.1 YHS domain-containing protein [Candidatus Bathyarchaeota archaeon]